MTPNPEVNNIAKRLNFSLQNLFTIITFILLLGVLYGTVQTNKTDIDDNKTKIDKKVDKEQYYRDIDEIKNNQKEMLKILIRIKNESDKR